MSVPADGQPSGLCYLPSHQEAATSAVWVQPSLEGDKTWQSLNALMEETEKRRMGRGCRSRYGENKGRRREERKQQKDKVFEAERGENERYDSKEENKRQIKIQSKRTDIVGWRLKHQK